MNKHLTAFTVGTLALSTLVVACGDDADSDTLSEEEFTEQANAICAGAEAEIGEAIGSVFGSGEEPTPEAMQEALDTIVASSRRQLDDIDALAEPSDLSDDLDAVLTEARSATDEAESQGLGFFEDDGDPFETANQMAADLGLEACAGES